MESVRAAGRLSISLGFICLAAATFVSLPSRGIRAESMIEIREPVWFKIMSADGSQQVGEGHYWVEDNASEPVLIGVDRYFDGEYDVERDRVQFSGHDAAFSLLRFEHSFYKPDGSLKYYTSADMRSGAAVCSADQSGQRQSRQIDFPPDTYAGATAMLILQNALREGSGRVNFHVFDCGPAPSVVAVAAHTNSNEQPWQLYGGSVQQVEITANLGVFGSIVSGLLPRRTAWFDVSGWKFAGAKIQRYLASGGPQVTLVRDFHQTVGLPGPSSD